MIARHLPNPFAASSKQASILSRNKNAQLVEVLATHEAKILKLIAHGKSVVETTSAFCLFFRPVTMHVKRIYGKLAVNNRI